MKLRLSTIILFSILITFMSCKEKVRAIESVDSKMSEASQKIIVKSSAGDVDIHYTTEGHGNAVIVFIHGWSCDQTYWKEQVAYFKNNYKVVTIDLGGHGKSGVNRTDWSIESFTTDVLDVINTLDFKSLNIIGHSMGVMVAVDVASKIDKNINTLVCVDYLKTPLPVFPPEVTEQMVTPFRADFVNSTKGFVGTMFLPDSDSTLIADISNKMSKAPAEIAIMAMKGLVERNFSSDFEKLSEKNIDRHIINSNMQPTDEVHYQSLGFKIHIIKDTGHFVMIEKATEFNALLDEILKP